MRSCHTKTYFIQKQIKGKTHVYTKWQDINQNALKDKNLRKKFTLLHV